MKVERMNNKYFVCKTSKFGNRKFTKNVFKNFLNGFGNKMSFELWTN